jgi:sn-glycerol 3-phosphate transport system permease protein
MTMNRWQSGTVYVLLAIAAILTIFPILYTFSAALMTDAESSTFPPKLLPGSLYLGNFANVTQMIPIWRFIVNSFIVSGVIMLGQLVTAAMAAYAFTFLRFVGRKALFAVFLATMMIPWEVTIIPNYLTMKSWGWLDSFQGLIIPFIATAFGTFLLRQFFLQLPGELFEAAKIDGSGHIRIFARIVLPLARPALATLAVYSFLTHWNMYLWPLLTTSGQEMRTVQIGIGMLQFAEVTNWNIVLAGVVMVLLPSLLLLVFGLKQLVQGITAGAVKG